MLPLDSPLWGELGHPGVPALLARIDAGSPGAFDETWIELWPIAGTPAGALAAPHILESAARKSYHAREPYWRLLGAIAARLDGSPDASLRATFARARRLVVGDLAVPGWNRQQVVLLLWALAALSGFARACERLQDKIDGAVLCPSCQETA